MSDRLKWVVLAASVLIGTSASAQINPNNVYIENLAYNGSGCPPESAVLNLADDAQAFTLIFSEYEAYAGPRVALTESRRNCQVNVTLHVPQGFTYAIASADYRGYANLQKGAKGLLKASYYFQGQPLTGSLQTPFNGPFANDWQVHHEAGVAALVWAPCGVSRSLNINTQVRIDKGNSTGESVMNMDSHDGKVETLYRLAWKKCP